MTHAIGRLSCVLTLTASLGGCTTVYVARPLGDEPAVLDPAEWNGTWCDPKDLAPQPGVRTPPAPDTECLVFTVVDSAAGVLDVSSPSEPADSYRTHLRYIGDDRTTVFASVEDGAAYTLELRARRDGNAVLAWTTSGGTFAREVEAGRLAGHTEEGSVQLDTPTPAALGRIAADDVGFFDWKRPVVLVRVNGS